MRVLDTPIDKIIVKDRYRTDKGDIEGLAESIKEKGLLQPIVLDSKLNLLAGERRYLACQLAGLKTIPTFIYQTKSKIDPLEIELIENTQRKDFTWQERARLERTIFELKVKVDPQWSGRKQAEARDESNSNINRRLQIAEAMELLPELAECKTEDDAWKEFSKLKEKVVIEELRKRVNPAIAQASKWAQDHYRVGDAFDGMRKNKAECAHFAEVDPPYGVDLGKVKSRNADKVEIGRYSEIDATEYEAFFAKVAAEVFRILRKDAFAVFWFGPTWQSETLGILRDVGFTVPDIPAVWTKGSVGQTASPDTTFGSCYEPFWLARKGKPKLAKPGRGNVFEGFAPVSYAKKIHATEKPLGLLEEILNVILLPGSAILIPFLGSGVTLRAAYKLGHTGWGYDLDPTNKELFLGKVRADIDLQEKAKQAA